MPRTRLIDTIAGEIVEDLGWFETAAQVRTPYTKHDKAPAQ